MSQADIKIKKQVVEKIKGATNILIALNQDPSVDELSASLGLAALLNKLDKHATAIFSGDVPASLNFLDPEKTFENTVDGLRDFIISLDKEKADHLRYKIEGDAVKIFITPYRTTISKDDLEFSQGDFNVELVLALNVSNQDNLDKALAAHGQIMHDAPVISITANDTTSQIGTIDWHDSDASGLCEMMTSLADVLKVDKALLDKQISTALLTGIVAVTDRFSNNKTSSNVMTLAAQLMANGADQQLIAAKLQEAHEINSLPPEANVEESKDESVGQEDQSTLNIRSNDSKESEEQSVEASSTLPPENGSIEISHGGSDELAKEVAEEADAAEKAASTLPPEGMGGFNPVDSIPAPVDDGSVASAYAFDDSSANSNEASPAIATEQNEMEPILGGTLNATTEQAVEEAKKAAEDDQNKTILSHHAYMGEGSGSEGAPAAPGSMPVNAVEPDNNGPEAQPQMEQQPMSAIPAPNPISMPAESPKHEPVIQPLHAIPDIPPPPPPVSPSADFTTLPPPPLPDFGAMPPAMPIGSEATIQPAMPPVENNPGQFQIPGQQ